MRFTEPVMRPPQEARSLLPRATQGCTYNKCKFCYISRGYPFKAVTPEDLEAEIAPLVNFYPPDTKIYLTGSNPFALPAHRLKEYIEVLRKYYPHFSELSMQTRIDNIPGKTAAELQELRNLGITHLYIGTENGSDEALNLMHKGYTSEKALQQLHRLDDAGIAYTCFYMLGMAGKGQGLKSGKATAEFFNKVHPRRITTTGLTIFKDAPVWEMVQRGEFTPASEREKVEELREFLANLKIDVFYDGIHYLNPLNYRFANSDTKLKAAVLADIDEALMTYSEEEFERMVGRENMISL